MAAATRVGCGKKSGGAARAGRSGAAGRGLWRRRRRWRRRGAALAAFKGDAACCLLPAQAEHPPPSARRGSPGIPERAGAVCRVWTARPGSRGSRGGWGPRAGIRGRRGALVPPAPALKGRSVGAPGPGWDYQDEIPTNARSDLISLLARYLAFSLKIPVIDD